VPSRELAARSPVASLAVAWSFWWSLEGASRLSIAVAQTASRSRYFKLPYSYWRLNIQNRIGLPAKAVLLIALSLREDFILPTERGVQWYGLSRDTVRKGLRDLRLLNFLSMWEVRKEAPLSAHGFTLERHYTLRAPFRQAGVGFQAERVETAERES